MNQILIIEDDRDISKLIVASLKKEGYPTLVAYDGAQGLLLFTSHRPDVILLDLGLPDIDGVDLHQPFPGGTAEDAPAGGALHHLREQGKDMETHGYRSSRPGIT